jgi:hypothetical protein
MTGPATRPAPAPAGFDDLFAGFLAETLDLPPAAAALPATASDGWPAQTARLLATAGPAYARRRHDHAARLTAALEATAAVVDEASLVAFVTDRLPIAAVPDFRESGDLDLCYVKINHGFWEQLYALFAAADPARMRISDPARFQGQYVASGFLAALSAATGRVARQEGGRLRFPDVHLGVSLASGTHDHPEVLAGFAARTPELRKIVIGAAIGLAAWWETLAPGHRPTFLDGSFPKRGLATGALRQALAWAAARSERIVFVVPAHLAGIRLADADIPQETVLVPSRTVHESWPGCLQATARHVLGRLAEDGRVLVITQSAVFSALLGFFLADAKRRLLPAASRLRYFDLGQVLDVAAPQAGGLWTQRHATGDVSLFRIDPE